MIIYIDTQTLDLTTEGYVPLTDMALVRGDKIPLRIVLKNGLGIDTDSQEVPVLAVKKSLGNDALVLAATGLQRVEDALGAAYVGSLVVNTTQLAEAMGDQDRIDLVGEVVLVAPDGAQRTSRLIRVAVRVDLLPDEYEPPAEVLADWSELVASSLANQLPAALHDAGMYVTSAIGTAYMSPPGYDYDVVVAWSWARFRFGDDLLSGYVGNVCKVRDVYMWGLPGVTDTTPRWLDVWRRAPGGDWVLASRSAKAAAAGTETDLFCWEMVAQAEIVIGDEVALHVYGGTPEDPVELPMEVARQMVTAADGRGLAAALDGPITDASVMPAMGLSCTYSDGVSVGGVPLATRTEIDRTKDYVTQANADVYASARQVRQDAQDAQDAATSASRAATNASNSANAAQQALAAMPQVDAGGNMTLAGGLTAAGAINANGGINIPLAVGAPTDTAAVNRMYAAGLAGVTDIYTQHYYLVTDNIAATGSATTKVHAPGHFAQTCIGAYGHGTVTHSFIGPSGQHNYSAFAGFSIPWRYTSICKFTVHIGRGSTTIRTDLTLDSYSVIPGNDLAYNLGEILDITFTNARDTVRNGYVVRVREIYALNSAEGWKVKTTTSFVPATNNEPVPSIVNKIIYQQCGPAPYGKDTYKASGALYLLTGSSARAQRLFKIATVRGLDTFEVGVGFSTIVSDLFNTSNYNNCLYVGSAERNLYQSGNINPVYYALDAVAANTVESEVIDDFVDINNPIQ